MLRQLFKYFSIKTALNNVCKPKVDNNLLIDLILRNSNSYTPDYLSGCTEEELNQIASELLKL